jgi:hypothetical protein
MRLFLLWLFVAGCQCGESPEGSSAEAPKLPPEASPSPANPVLFIAVDGLACDLAAPLMKSGQMPNVSALASRGRFGTVATAYPTQSPIIWTTIATGVGQEKHGINGFLANGTERMAKAKSDKRHGNATRKEIVQNEWKKAKRKAAEAGQPPPNRKRVRRRIKRKLKSGLPLVQSVDRKVKALWNIADDAGLNVATVGWWVTWHVEKVNGVMIAQTNTTLPNETEAIERNRKGSVIADFPGQVWPTSLEPMLNQTLTEVDASLDANVERIFGRPHDPSFGRVWDALWNQSMWSIRSDAAYHTLALDLMKTAEKPYDLFMVYYGGTDVLAHRFFRAFRPDEYTDRPSEAEIAAFGTIIPSYYQEFDRMLGELVAAAPKNANIIVVSDHGMHAENTDKVYTRKINSGGHHDAPAACLFAAGPDIRKPKKGFDVNNFELDQLPQYAKIIGLTPTVVRLLKLPIAEDLEGMVKRGIIRRSFLS